jgi:hypothetical protein
LRGAVKKGLSTRSKELEKVTFDRHLPLNERILRIDHIQARRYSKLNGVALDIATEGIMRHLRACDRMDVNPDTSAVREIIDDALNGRRVFAETGDDRQRAA